MHISRIFLFNSDEEKREVKLNSGLNIITGDSKTGKSAIIEIIDYCLFSSRSTIPKGIINDWSKLFCIVLKIKEKHIIIGRPSFRSDNSNKVYFNIETNQDFLDNFSINYFNDIELKPLKESQVEFEKHLGISVLDTRSDEEENKQKSGGKVTMRSFMPFLFQHQNLIANKHSLFYRFDDFYKRKKTIEDYPILMGWENSEYFILRRELEEKSKQLKAEKKLIDKIKIDNNELENQLYHLLSSYYKFTGKVIDDGLPLRDLKKIANNLPEINKKSFSDNQLKLEIQQLINDRKNLKIQLDETLELLEKLKTNSNLSNDYNSNLHKLKSFVSVNYDFEELLCPVCNHEVDDLVEKVNTLKTSKENLIDEFSKIGTYTNDSSKQIEHLNKERDRLKKEINTKSNDINKIEQQIIDIDNNNSFYENAYILKGATEANAKNLIERSKISKTNSIDIEELEIDIKKLKERLEGYNLQIKINEAEVLLSNKMTEICNKLDFEKELKPGKLHFSFKDFAFKYNFNDKEDILLTEMGSGSNWLAIHLSVFLGFLYLNSISKKSSIPSILVLDQPSQVYFPNKYGIIEKEDFDNEIQDESEIETKKDENIEQVKNIFNVLISEIDNIYKEVNFKPQIIVLEHADESEFKDYVEYRWKKDGDKLI